MAEPSALAGRSYARVYAVQGKSDLHAFLAAAVSRSGGKVLYASAPTRAPVFLGVEIGEDERLALLCYPFRFKRGPIKGRPSDEQRGQIRYGSESSWIEDHPLGIDVAGVDITLVLGVQLEDEVFIGLDPVLYDPLPMGISVELKNAHVEAISTTGWHVWERVNRAGNRRSERRSLSGMETLIGFRPERLLDYARLERQATALALDPVLREKAALAAAARPLAGRQPSRHVLEETFDLTSAELMDIIANRMRLTVAVKGGVAEHHLQRALEADPYVLAVTQIDEDGRPDLDVVLRTGRKLLVECKNGLRRPYKGGEGRVEVQKTRSSKGDPASRLYFPEQFDLVAVCLWPETGPPTFRFKHAERLEPDERYPDRIAPNQRIDDSWALSLSDAL